MAADRLITRPEIIQTLREQAHASAMVGELALSLLQSLLPDRSLPHHTQDFGERMKLTRAVERVVSLQQGTREAMRALAQSLQGLGLVAPEQASESELPPLNESEVLALYTYLIQIVRALEPKIEAIMSRLAERNADSKEPSAEVLDVGEQLLAPRDVTEHELAELFGLLLGGE